MIIDSLYPEQAIATNSRDAARKIVVSAAKSAGLQQQGVSHEKSHMQVAEEQQSAWLNVPRIAVCAFEGASDLVGGGTGARERMERALAKAEEQWTNGVEAELQMCSERHEAVYGADKAPTDSRGNVHGIAKCTSGNVYVGQFQHVQLHGQGTFNYADGGVYVQHDKRHGGGKVRNATDAFLLVSYVDDEPSGEAVWFSKDRQETVLVKDEEVPQELSRSEAAKKVEELDLSKLLS